MDTRYRIEIEYVEDVWEVRFPQLRGCVGRGHTIEEAIDAARFAQEDYLGRFATAHEQSKLWGGQNG
jgi:predicted RNase H-like HicB family nuclease